MKQIWAPWRLSYLQGENLKLDGCVFCAKQTEDDSVEHILYRGSQCLYNPESLSPIAMDI